MHPQALLCLRMGNQKTETVNYGSLLAKQRWAKATDAEKAEQSRLMHEGRWGKKRKKAKS